MADETVTINAACETLRVSRVTLYRMIDRGDIVAVRSPGLKKGNALPRPVSRAWHKGVEKHWRDWPLS